MFAFRVDFEALHHKKTAQRVEHSSNSSFLCFCLRTLFGHRKSTPRTSKIHSLDALGALLGALWASLGALWSSLGALGPFLAALGERLGALGAFLDALGAHMGVVGPLLGGLGAPVKQGPAAEA